MEKLTVSVYEAAEALGVGKDTVYQLCKTKDFPAFKAGSRTLISVKGLVEWVRRQAEGDRNGKV